MRLPRPLVVAFAVASLVAAGGAIVPPPAGAYPVSTLNVVGHGWGHGRGMGQFGALGYALNHGWTEQQILENYPSLTREGLRAVFAYAAECMREERIHATPQ